MTKRESGQVAQFLEIHGIGVEPDCRFCGSYLGKSTLAVLFRLQPQPDEKGPIATGEPSDSYRAAALLLHLAAAIAGADGTVSPEEEDHLLEQAENYPGLSSLERHRLRQHTRWLLKEPPSLAGLKRRMEVLSKEDRHTAGHFAISVAGADGRIDPEEIKILRRIYPLLGLEAEAVISDLHSLMSDELPAGKPAVVAKSGSRDGRAIPKPSVKVKKQGITLDVEKIRATRAASQRISGVLSEIFEEAEPEMVVAEVSAEAGPRLGALDVAHSSFLRAMGAKLTWTWEEIEGLAESCGVLPDGALELVNEEALESHGDLLLEGSEVIEIDPEILEEMLA